MSRIRRSAPGRLSFTVLTLLAIAIQSFVVQPHIHRQHTDTLLASSSIDGDAALADDTSAGKDPSKHHPVGQDRNDCPMCQSAHQNGHYLKPTAAIFALPVFVNYRTVELVQLPAVPKTASHSWRGRAPPKS